MIEVLQYIPSYDFGGIESYVSNLNSELYKICKFTYVVEKDITKEEVEKIKRYKANIIRIPNLTKENPIKHILAIKKILKCGEYDVVHVHGCDIRIFMMLYAKKYKIMKRIYHIHSARIERYSKVKKIFMKINVKMSNKILACSEKAAQSMLGREHEKAIIVKNGIKINDFKFDYIKRSNIRKKLGIDDDTIIIGNVGRLVEVKNQKYLLEVLEEILKGNKKVKLLIAGDGELMETLKKISEDKKISNNVIFLGKIENVNELYSAFDIFCLPSLAEGLGMVLLEAQVNGLKCVASKNVPEEADVTGNVLFLETKKENIKEWENAIMLNKATRYDNIEKIENSGCDLLQSSKRILEIYDEGEKVGTYK